jgi:hypothetical protein
MLSFERTTPTIHPNFGLFYEGLIHFTLFWPYLGRFRANSGDLTPFFSYFHPFSTHFGHFTFNFGQKSSFLPRFCLFFRSFGRIFTRSPPILRIISPHFGLLIRPGRVHSRRRRFELLITIADENEDIYRGRLAGIII